MTCATCNKANRDGRDDRVRRFGGLDGTARAPRCRVGAPLRRDPVNVAARLQDQGRDGDVVIGEATQQLVATLVTLAPLGSMTLKGRAEAMRAYRVVSLDRLVAIELFEPEDLAAAARFEELGHPERSGRRPSADTRHPG